MSDIDLKNRQSDATHIMQLNSGYSLPMVGLGTYALHGKTCTDAVSTAIKSGYRLIDTASLYRNEREVGEGVRQSGVPREEIFVQTKLFPDQYNYAEKAIDEALEKLDLGYIDMMLLHHPASNDVLAYKAIEKAIHDGKVRSAGISCYYIAETDSFLEKVSIKPSLVQNEVHPYYQDSPVVEHIQKKGIVVQGFFPFGGRGHTMAMLNDPLLKQIAKDHNKTVAQIILRWDIQKSVAVIPGSSNPYHIKDNIDIFDFELTSEEMKSIATLNKNEKHDWY